jgi:hypothetical protein
MPKIPKLQAVLHRVVKKKDLPVEPVINYMLDVLIVPLVYLVEVWEGGMSAWQQQYTFQQPQKLMPSPRKKSSIICCCPHCCQHV